MTHTCKHCGLEFETGRGNVSMFNDDGGYDHWCCWDHFVADNPEYSKGGN